jgi:hypothetical protein
LSPRKILALKKRRSEEMLRKNKIELALNDKELKAINHYCNRYRISNRSKFFREAILMEVLRRFDHDYPSLFEDHPSPL